MPESSGNGVSVAVGESPAGDRKRPSGWDDEGWPDEPPGDDYDEGSPSARQVPAQGGSTAEAVQRAGVEARGRAGSAEAAPELTGSGASAPLAAELAASATAGGGMEAVAASGGMEAAAASGGMEAVAAGGDSAAVAARRPDPAAILPDAPDDGLEPVVCR